MSTPESFINNDPLTADSWPTLDEVNPLDPLTTEIPLVADLPRKTVPKPPDVDEILDGSYTTGWIPVIVPGESLQTAEERALERIRRIEAQLDAEDYGIPIPAEFAQPMAAAVKPQETAAKKSPAKTRPQEPVARPTHSVRISDSGDVSFGDDLDEILSPSAVLDQARRRIQQMRDDLETNVELVTRSFEHPMFNPVESESVSQTDDQEVAATVNRYVDFETESKDSDSQPTTTGTSATAEHPGSGDELIVIHTNVDPDRDGPMTAPVDTAAVRQALDDVAQDVFIITNKNKAGPALNSDELLEALQNVAKRIEATTSLVDAASKFIDHKVEGVHAGTEDIARPDAGLFTHRPVSQEIPDDATQLSDLLEEVEANDSVPTFGNSPETNSKIFEVSEPDPVAGENVDAPQPNAKVQTAKAKGKMPPAKKPQATQKTAEPITVKSFGLNDKADSESPSLRKKDNEQSNIETTSASGDNEEIFLSDLISALDHMVETATDITKSTALDEVLSKYQHILDAPTGSVPVVEEPAARPAPKLDISAMIAQIKQDAQSLLDEDVLESLRVDIPVLSEESSPAPHEVAESSETVDITEMPTPLVDALLAQQATSEESKVDQSSSVELDSESTDGDHVSESTFSEELPQEPEISQREKSAAAQAQKVIQDIVDRLEAAQPTPPLVEGIAEALRPVDLPKIFRSEPSSSSANEDSSRTQTSHTDPQPLGDSSDVDKSQSVGTGQQPASVTEHSQVPIDQTKSTESHESDSKKSHDARTEFAATIPSATYVLSDQLPKDNSLELVIMRDEIRDLRDRLDASQKLIEDLMIRLANLTEIAIQGRQN